MKERSWREMQVFMECYSDAGDIIKLAWEIDNMCIYPITVISMLEIFNANVCYEEYCEYEFEQSNTWESIALGNQDDENWDGPIFFIKSYEF